MWCNLKNFHPEPLPNCAQHPAENTKDEDKNKKLHCAQHPLEKTSARTEAQ
jgi:hypothetical protein